ncbi:MAG: glycosyltransferase family 9 protein [Planctomycetes bacterium]|nr:glycosyltransferase family 9 protein [Planctomycetota bacterium]
MPAPAWFRPDSRILVIRLSAVGDVINTLPALCAIRHSYPRAFVGWIVEDRAYDLIRGHPAIDRVHLFPRRRWVHAPWRAPAEAAALIREIRRERYDVAVDLQGNLKGAVHGLASGIRRRVGFSREHCREWNHLFTNVHVTPPDERINRVDKFLAVAAFLGADVNGAAYRLPEAPESRVRADEFLAREGLRGYVVLHPGTSEVGREKRWLPERFSALAERIGAGLGLRAVVTWGPGERELAAEVAAGGRGHAVLSMPTRSILDLAELIRRARLFVGCDSGPLHLASAVGTPSVGLFGPKDPTIYGPYNPFHRIVYKPGDHGGAMESITVDEAYRAAAELLSQTAHQKWTVHF